MKRQGFVSAGFVMIFLFATHSHAGLTRVVPNFLTTNYTNPAQQQLNVVVEEKN